MLTSLALLATLAFTPAAEAHVVVSVSIPGIVVDAWSPHYVPAARAGWVWRAGYHDAWGQWVPGFWRPSAARVGYDWVDGHWVGAHYYDGYWRPVSRVGYSWVPGAYHSGLWVEGYWGGWHAARLYERHEARVEHWRDERLHDRHEAVRERVHTASQSHQAADTDRGRASDDKRRSGGGSHASSTSGHQAARSTGDNAPAKKHARSTK